MRAFPPFGEPVQARRGMILLIVITLLTLFAVTGLSFVFYAESEARSAKAFREAADNYRPDVDPETALAFFLGKLIYGETNDTAGSASALRGHDLTGGAYGHNYAVNASGQLVLNPTAPFTGTGRTHVLNTAGVIAGLDDYRLINYTWFKADGFLRDPARLGTRTDPTATLGTYTGGFNVPWTYPDLNNMYLGAVRADGTVLTPSFHREYLFGRLDDPANPNWTSPEGKYLTLRPRPADHLGFPFPEGRFGDVQNLPWGTGGPDSIWIDIGAPVITAPDGRKYKMLVAPLIIDLDGRINLNVAGNIKNAGAYTGRQGWGRWEINVNKVLPVTAETPNLFKGRTQTSGTNIKNLQGRYAFGAAGPAGTPLPPPGAGQFYSPFDFDGSATAFPTLPAGTTSVWPTYVAGYDNGTAAELANHPGGFDYFAAARGGSANRLLPVSDMEALLRYRDKGSPAMYSETFDLLPRNFNPATSAATARVRGLVTHRSMDFATPGQVAWLWNPTTAGYAYNYVATNPNANFPTGPAIPFPTILPRQAPPAGSEFDANWQAIPAVIQRLDLNRKLTNYPAPDPATGLMDLSIAANQTAFTNAQNDRQQFARDIYNLLVKVTGARDPNTDAAVRDAVPNQAAFRAARWLAHLAVNIVDYIDNDDYMTPFNWFGAEWVFGTELPRLVLNEAYAQYDNDGDPSGFTLVNTVKTATHYQLNVWLELHNPFKTMTDPSRDNGTAVLQSPSGQSAYRLLLTKPNTNLRDPANLRGDPDTAANQVLNAVTNWGPTAVQQTVLPANGATSGPAGSNQGFYVLGPQATYLPNRNPNIPVTFASSSMSTLYPGNTTAAQAPTAAANHPTILLQRLACPHLPFNATTNPYITTDYMENLPVNENREYRPTVIAGVPLPTTRTSVGRRQPWAGWAGTTNSQRAAQTTVVAGQPNNTFYSQNVPATSPYQWLVHLDRQLISPMELLYVSGYRPHELTQQFRTTGTAQQFTHYAPWFVNNARLYRFFEFAGTHDYFAGTSIATRRPGLVNINTVWDQEILNALLGNATALQQTAIFNQVILRRTPGLAAGGTGVIGATDAYLAAGTDHPYRPLSTGQTAASVVSATGGQYPVDTGINNTILAPIPAPTVTNTDALAKTVFDSVNGGHPYIRHEWLTKIFNSVTTRSNVFAVFVTVGFFEVKDDTTRPVKLGAEVGRADNRHVRHRMFAIVDRSDTRITLMSQLTATPQAVTLRMAQGVTVPPGQTVPVTETLPKDYSLTFQTANGAQFSIQPGTTLVYDPDTVNEEIVTVASVNTTANPQSFVVNMRQSHAQGTPIVIRGNPGPWPSYSPRNDRGVVPYYSIID